MKFVYLTLFVSTLAVAGENRTLSCKSAYTGRSAQIESADNGNHIASSKISAKIEGLFNLPGVGLVQEIVLNVPRTQCDFDAQDSALLRCSHVFGPGATIEMKTETGNRNLALQHAQLETLRVTGVREKKVELRLRFLGRPSSAFQKLDLEFFDKDCTANAL
jgi:hypothetical protein